MAFIPGFILSEKVFEGKYSLVYHGFAEDTKKRVIIKFLKSDRPALEEVARIEHEYDLLTLANGQGTVEAYGIKHFNDNAVLILQAYGQTLESFILSNEISLSKFLTMAISITEALGQIHQKEIIHKDLNPSNILIDATTQVAKIIDFGLSTTLPRENPEISHANILGEGTLPYMSPEQTGRMNRGIDYRTDYYSLGVILYKLATKRLPFITEDPSELVHCHLAKIPIHPKELNKDIPAAVDNIIMKLLEKSPEERYQSTFGIKSDLENCLHQLEKQGTVEEFPLGQEDVSSKFLISEKLYGRKIEAEQLLEIFERASRGKVALIFVSGYSGVGKTSLVHEIYKPIVKKQAYFIAGKFDQFSRDRPYQAWIQALNNMIDQILEEPENRIESWRKYLQKVLGANGQLIIDILPKLAQIIGKQPPVKTLGLNESRDRFMLLFLGFIQAFATEDHPMVIHLDDCQWADTSSLELLEAICTNVYSRHLLVVGSYRDNEINSQHIFQLSLENLIRKGFNYYTIALKPLQLIHINELLTDTFSADSTQIAALAEICQTKTQGNPFFLGQFLDTLYKEKLIEFNFEKGKWQWDIKQIQDRNMTDNVVELMVNKIKVLPQKTQDILKIASCLGSRFDLKTLVLISNETPKKAAVLLWDALAEGIITTTNDNYKYVRDSEDYNIRYHFSHGRIQQAAYSLIEENQLTEIQVNIGNLLLKNTHEENLSENVIEIVNHMNFGLLTIDNKEERRKLVELNMMAGFKSKASVAYRSALNYFNTAITLLGENIWEEHYSLAIKLHNEMIESAYLATSDTTLEVYSQAVIEHAKNMLDKISVYETKIMALSQDHKFKEAIDLSIDLLKKFRTNLTRSSWSNDVRIILNSYYIKLKLMNKDGEELTHLPKMEDPEKLAAMRILGTISLICFLSNKKLLLMVTLISMCISLKYGQSTYSISSYVYYAIILCTKYYKVKEALYFISLAESLNNEFHDEGQAIRIDFIKCFLSPWHKHIEASLLPLTELTQRALEAGSTEYGSIAALSYALRYFACGKPLLEARQKIKNTKRLLTSLEKLPALNHLSVYDQTVQNLLGLSDDPVKLMGAACNEVTLLKNFIATDNHTGAFIIHTYKCVLAYTFEEYDIAYQAAVESDIYYEDVSGVYPVTVETLYYSLASLEMYEKSSPIQQKKILEKVNDNQKRFKIWSKNAPMNCLHKYYIVEAQLANVLGKRTQANNLFDKAIELAKENHFLNESALANELAAKYYLKIGKKRIAKVYMQDAYYCYVKWGATAKLKQLEKKYSELLENKSLTLSGNDLSRTMNITRVTHFSQDIKYAVDLSTIMKAAQTISKEIVLSDLLRKMMRIVIENVGAQIGFLLLEKEGEWYIEAEAAIDNDKINVLQGQKISEKLPVSVIKQVIKDKKPLVINDAIHSDRYSVDPYIMEIKPKSILCIPLINHGILSSIIYLENNLATDIFTTTKIETLNILSGHFVISIDNARLYDHLTKLNKAYECFVPKEFLSLLEKKSILDVKLGDQVQKEMTVMFCDIRSFTSLSENLSAQKTMDFLNIFLSKMIPEISKYHGVVDKYIGDAIMALFPNNADEALNCAISMMRALHLFNNERIAAYQKPIDMGLGLNTGLLVLGTMGDTNRMEGTVIADAVNVASRIEELNKIYSTHILITEATYQKLKYLSAYAIRKIDIVLVRGKRKRLVIYEVFDMDSEKEVILKRETLADFEKAVSLFHTKKYQKAIERFERILQKNSNDFPAKVYIKRCRKLIFRKRLQSLP